MQGAAATLDLETVFLDVTLVSQNLHNCFVEGLTSSEGMLRLIDHVGGLGRGLVVGGEGRNEVTARGLSFAQAHLFRSWQENAEGLERTGGCALGEPVRRAAPSKTPTNEYVHNNTTYRSR